MEVIVIKIPKVAHDLMKVKVNEARKKDPEMTLRRAYIAAAMQVEIAK